VAGADRCFGRCQAQIDSVFQPAIEECCVYQPAGSTVAKDDSRPRSWNVENEESATTACNSGVFRECLKQQPRPIETPSRYTRPMPGWFRWSVPIARCRNAPQPISDLGSAARAVAAGIGRTYDVACIQQEVAAPSAPSRVSATPCSSITAPPFRCSGSNRQARRPAPSAAVNSTSVTLACGLFAPGVEHE